MKKLSDLPRNTPVFVDTNILVLAGAEGSLAQRWLPSFQPEHGLRQQGCPSTSLHCASQGCITPSSVRPLTVAILR